MKLSETLIQDAPRNRSTRETAEEAAERLGLGTAGKPDAAEAKALRASIGAHYSEIRAVEDTPDGPVVTTDDGVRMIWRGASNPDASGNVGWLLLGRPDGLPDPPEGEKDARPRYATPLFDAGPALEDEPGPAPKPKPKPKAAKPKQAAKPRAPRAPRADLDDPGV